MTTQNATRTEPTVLGGRYVLGELLGSGGMAQVFRARDSVLARDVAVKVFRQDSVLPDGEVRRGGEVRLLAGLSHPGLVMVFDAGRDESDPFSPFSYLVMELVEGTTLARVLDSGPMGPRQVATLGAQLAGALAYVHGHGIVHRDVKPANVLMGGEDASVAKLTDFGVARLVDSTRLTVEGTTLGTANYLAPEQTTSSDVTSACDVYSLGLVLLECLTGAVAFPGHGVAAAVARLHRDPVVPTWVDDGWRALLTAMTAREPGDRPTAGEVAVRLAGLAAVAGTPVGASVETGPVRAAAPERPVRRKHRTRTLVAALAAAAAVAAVVVIGTSSSADPVAAAAPTPKYPQVTGQLGTDLRTLESLAPQQLAPGVRTVASRSAVHDFHAAQQALSRVLDRLGVLHDQGRVDDATNAKVATAIARVESDLMRDQVSLDAAESKAAARAMARSAAAQAAAARRAAAASRAAAAARSAEASRAAEARAAARAAARRAAAQRASLEAARRQAATRTAPGPGRGPGHAKSPKPPKAPHAPHPPMAPHPHGGPKH